MNTCAECGTRIYSNGICPNCDEELTILTDQFDDIDAISDEFADKAREQAVKASERIAANKPRPQ